jgi:hypothetical protein
MEEMGSPMQQMSVEVFFNSISDRGDVEARGASNIHASAESL